MRVGAGRVRIREWRDNSHSSLGRMHTTHAREDAEGERSVNGVLFRELSKEGIFFKMFICNCGVESRSELVPFCSSGV
jgi:hypothetical protein